jgi:cytochrome c oxidase subunit 1
MSQTWKLAAKNKNYFSICFFLLAICNFPYLLFWVHQRIVFGLNPFLGSVFLLIGLLILFPVGIKVVRWARKNWFDDFKTEPVVLFAVGLISWDLYMFRSWNSTMDFHFHDTYYVFSIFSVLLFGSSFFAIFCIVYYLFPRIFRHGLNITYSRIHFWITYWGLWFIFWKTRIDQTILFTGEGYQPRRYVEYSGWADFRYFQESNRHLLIAVILVLAAQILFLYNIIYSLLKGRREVL